MNASEFSERLFQSEPDSPQAAELARDLVDDAHYPANFALQHYLSSADEDEQLKAKNLLADLREFTLVPLAGSAPSPDLATELWVIRTMTVEMVAFRIRTASVLKDLLVNRRQASSAEDGSSPPYPPGTRVCDLAFVLLHRILHLELSLSAFLGMPLAWRDKRIKEFQESREFRAAFERHL